MLGHACEAGLRCAGLADRSLADAEGARREHALDADLGADSGRGLGEELPVAAGEQEGGQRDQACGLDCHETGPRRVGLPCSGPGAPTAHERVYAIDFDVSSGGSSIRSAG